MKGVGRLRFPISRELARRLLRVARPARYGRGEETLLDRRAARREDDWSIALPPGCSCDLCRTLGSFLADPKERRFEWPLAKERRQHVHRRLDGHELPVRHQTRRSGRPFVLVLTKDAGLFAREAAEHRTLVADLAWLRGRTGADGS